VARLEEVMDPAYLDGLETWPLSEVRARRESVTEVETGLSYLRRIVQGRLDIVIAEQHRRLEGEESGDLSHLVEQLPKILSGHVRAPGLGRLPAMMGPGAVDPSIEGELEAILPASQLGSLPELSDADLADRAERLNALERSVSSQRRAVRDVFDHIQDEVVRRFRTGEATLENLLP
jgi:hypothetical protein